jgi:hypothetical protein
MFFFYYMKKIKNLLMSMYYLMINILDIDATCSVMR